MKRSLYHVEKTKKKLSLASLCGSHYLDRNQAISVPSVRRAVHCVEDVCKKV